MPNEDKIARSSWFDKRRGGGGGIITGVSQSKCKENEKSFDVAGVRYIPFSIYLGSTVTISQMASTLPSRCLTNDM